MKPTIDAILKRAEMMTYTTMEKESDGCQVEMPATMPIIRELCAELSKYIDDCYCTGDTDFNGPGQVCKPCKTKERLATLAGKG